MGADDLILDRPINVKMKCLPIPKFNHERLLSKIKIDEKTQCWNWTGWIHNPGGYGKITMGKKDYLAHRCSYDLFVGIKEDYTVIDHICMNKICINPDHLREVDVRTNTLENSRGDAVKKKAQTHCINGHEFTPENTKPTPTGPYGGLRRTCKKCCAIRNSNWYQKKKKRS